MSFKDQIPEELFNEIVNHIQNECRFAQPAAYRRARSDEDTLTGDFWGKIAISDHFQAPSGWSWEIEYKRIRGRGAGAPEKKTGSDGIFQIDITDQNGNHLFRKSFLFQAKMDRPFNRSAVLPQLETMNEINKKAGILIVYSENSFNSYKADEFVESTNATSQNICDYITNIFFECKHGVENMYYNMDEEIIIIYDEEQGKAYEYLGEGKYQVISLNIHRLKN